MAVGFPLFCPRRKWTKERRNMTPGDVVLLKPDTKFGKGEFRLGRVLSVLPDPDGYVRTVMLGLRKRRGRGRENRLVCNTELEEVPMAVQRLVVIQASEECAALAPGDPQQPPSPHSNSPRAPDTVPVSPNTALLQE